MSRQIDLSISQAVPKNERGWTALGERLESIWRVANRKRLGGIVSLNFFWQDYKTRGIEEESEAALELASRIDFMLRPGTRIFIGQARCEKAEQNQLRLWIKEDS